MRSDDLGRAAVRLVLAAIALAGFMWLALAATRAEQEAQLRNARAYHEAQAP